MVKPHKNSMQLCLNDKKDRNTALLTTVSHKTKNESNVQSEQPTATQRRSRNYAPLKVVHNQL